MGKTHISGVFTPNLVTQSPRQLVDHLLCRECEERMAKLGEARCSL
jgi:hypothetical protein